MRITKIVRHSKDELLSRLRNITMLKNPDIYVYKNALISLEYISTECLYPAQRYVLIQEINKVRKLKWELEKHGVDLFSLDGFIKIWFENAEEPIDLLPPIIEESIEKNGKVVNIINDGMHRIYLARLEWVIPQVVFVRGLPKEFPYYAYPNPDQWKGIELVDSLPEGYVKKWHRIENYHSLYRNFNSAFDNVGAPRPRFENANKGQPGT